MVYVFLGPPGSGKDTQAALLSKLLNLPLTGTGDLMRREIANDNEFGKQLKVYVAEGKWPPLEMVMKVLESEIEGEKYKGGFIITGFPRTIEQVREFDKMLGNLELKLTSVVHFDLTEEEMYKRLENQTKDTDGSRPDSTKDAMVGRYRSYAETISPILEEYEKRGILIKIDARPGIEEIHEEVKKQLGINN